MVIVQPRRIPNYLVRCTSLGISKIYLNASVSDLSSAYVDSVLTNGDAFSKISTFAVALKAVNDYIVLKRDEAFCIRDLNLKSN